MTKQCFPNISRRHDTRDPFKFNKFRTIPRTIDKLHNGLQGDNFDEIFSDSAEVLNINLAIEESNTIVIADQNNLSNIHQVLIVDSFCQRINGTIQLSLDLRGTTSITNFITRMD